MCIIFSSLPYPYLSPNHLLFYQSGQKRALLKLRTGPGSLAQATYWLLEYCTVLLFY